VIPLQPVIELSFRADSTNNRTNFLEAEVLASRRKLFRGAAIPSPGVVAPQKNNFDAYQMAYLLWR